MSNTKKRVPLLCISLFVLISSCFCASGDGRCAKTSRTFSESILSLAARLANEIGEEDNYVFSPLSISAALAMLYIGSGGTTKSQMSVALQYNLFEEKCPDLKILEGFKDMFLSLEVEKEMLSLIVANCVFVQRGYKISSNYESKVQEYFNSEINYVDFANEEQLSMKKINQWVSNKTKNHVEKLLVEPLDPMTMMVLANVVYFKGLWKHSFSNTWNSYFHTSNGTTKIVSFMKVEEKFQFYQDNNYLFLEMNYVDSDISMLLVLPVDTHETPKFQLTSDTLYNVRSKLKEKVVMVGLPRVQLQYRRELSRDMIKFGMTNLFSDRPDLTGISEQDDLHVSLMIHKAVIEINEQGSEASGLSGIGIVSRIRPSHEATFWANHPFLFYIIDKRKETVLFVGRVNNP